jgi:hypothetical protein
MKKTMFILAIVALALSAPLAPDVASAFPRDGAEQDYSALPPEKARFIDKTLEENATLTRPLHRELRQKYQELEYVSRLQKTEVKDVTRILDEIKSLQNRLDDLRQAANDKILKETGIDYRPGPRLAGRDHGRWNKGCSNGYNQSHGWAGGTRYDDGRPQDWKHGSGHERGRSRHQRDFDY